MEKVYYKLQYRIRQLEYYLISKDRRGYLVAQDFQYEDVQKTTERNTFYCYFTSFFNLKV